MDAELANEELVSGEIAFGDDAEPFSAAMAFVRVDDVSMTDVPTTFLSQQVIENVAYQPGHTIPFTVYGRKPDDDRARLQLSVHISLHGSDDVAKGDYITMESYPVVTQGHPSEVRVFVRRV
jgi:uncharacterized lipoprotein YbaY